MGLFDDVVEKTKNAADIACKKAEGVIDISKLKYSEAEIKRNLTETYTQLGKDIYAAYKSDESNKGVIEKSSKEIDNLILDLDSIKQEIAASKDKVSCPKCGTENDKEFVFCYKCGAKLD